MRQSRACGVASPPLATGDNAQPSGWRERPSLSQGRSPTVQAVCTPIQYRELTAGAGHGFPLEVQDASLRAVLERLAQRPDLGVGPPPSAVGAAVEHVERSIDAWVGFLEPDPAPSWRYEGCGIGSGPNNERSEW
jgi:hypothetical protein